jgi:hypothetical protein
VYWFEPHLTTPVAKKGSTDVSSCALKSRSLDTDFYNKNYQITVLSELLTEGCEEVKAG